MARFQLWHTNSSTLLEETDDLFEISNVVQSFVDDSGPDIPDDLALSEWNHPLYRAMNTTGQEIMTVLQEHLAQV
jgi:hypothetical protein